MGINNLEPGVHLEEVEVLLGVAEELHRTRRVVPDSLRQLYRLKTSLSLKGQFIEKISHICTKMKERTIYIYLKIDHACEMMAGPYKLYSYDNCSSTE